MKAIVWAVILVDIFLLWLTRASGVNLVAAALILIAALSETLMRSLVRVRRRRALLDAYADREIARTMALHND